MLPTTRLTAPTTTPPTATPTRPTAESLSEALTRCVGDAREFLDTSWTRRPHRATSPSTAGFADLLSLADADRIIGGTSPRTPAIRLVRDGEPIDPARYTRSARVGTVRHHDVADAAKVLDLYDQGATIVLQSLQRWWPPLATFCRDLEVALSHPVQANAYLTPSGARGLAPHHDTHDVFVLQSHGTKHWQVREPIVEAPLPRHRSNHDEAAAQPVLFEADLGPGDCLYLPRGWVHSAAAQQGTSLHITIGVLATTAHDVLRALVDRAAEEPAFRRTLPVGYVDDPAPVVEELARDLAAWLDKVDAAEVGATLARRFWANRRPLLEGQLLQLTGLDQLDDHSTVRRRAGAVCHLARDDEQLVVLLGDRELRMPAVLEPAVARLADGAPHRTGELADLMDEHSRLVLVRRLIREGLLEAMHGP
jgi:lysine-specific demethylase/histidyl-hydroxylase NO66